MKNTKKETLIKYTNKLNLEIVEYNENGKSKLKDKDGYLYSLNNNNLACSLSNNSKPSRFFGCNIYTIENIKNYILLEGLNITMIEDNLYIISGKTEICFKCNIHNNIFHKSWNYIRQGSICPICAEEKIQNNRIAKRILIGKEVYQSFIDNDFTPLFKPEDYIDSRQKLPYICNKHPNEGTQYKESCSVNYGCWQCGRDKGKGDNHYAWKGGVSPINEYLRRHLITWKKEGMNFNNYKCVLTGQRFEIIHHLHSFESIAKEVFETNTIPVNPISEYSKQELKTLNEKSIELHYKYGFGICLIKPLHNLFHREYTEMDNTPIQFLEFVHRLESHEFDDYLAINNLVLNINYIILNKLLAQFNLSYETELINLSSII